MKEELKAGEDYSYKDLSGKDLRGLDLRGCNLDCSNLRGAKIDKSTKLEGASLRYAHLIDVEIEEGALEGIDVTKAVIREIGLKEGRSVKEKGDKKEVKDKLGIVQGEGGYTKGKESEEKGDKKEIKGKLGKVQGEGTNRETEIKIGELEGMHIRVSLEEVKKGLNVVKSMNNLNKLDDCKLKIEAIKEKVSIKGYSGQINQEGTQTELECVLKEVEVLKEGSVWLNVKEVTGVITKEGKKVTNAEIELGLLEGNKVGVVKEGELLGVLEVKEGLELRCNGRYTKGEIVDEVEIKYQAKHIENIIKKVGFARSKEKTKPELNGIIVEHTEDNLYGEDGNKSQVIIYEAIDGYRAAQYKHKTSQLSERNKFTGMVLSKELVGVLSDKTLLKDKEKVIELGINKGSMCAKLRMGEGVELESKLKEAQSGVRFEKLANLTEKGISVKIEVKRDDLLKAVEEVKKRVKEVGVKNVENTGVKNIAVVRVILEEERKEILMRVKSELGDIEIPIKVKRSEELKEGRRVEVGFNLKYLEESIKAQEKGTTVELALPDRPIDAIMINGRGETSTTRSILLPYRIRV